MLIFIEENRQILVKGLLISIPQDDTCINVVCGLILWDIEALDCWVHEEGISS